MPCRVPFCQVVAVGALLALLPQQRRTVRIRAEARSRRFRLFKGVGAMAGTPAGGALTRIRVGLVMFAVLASYPSTVTTQSPALIATITVTPTTVAPNGPATG